MWGTFNKLVKSRDWPRTANNFAEKIIVELCSILHILKIILIYNYEDSNVIDISAFQPQGSWLDIWLCKDLNIYDM